ncbi:hypothetical protein [Sphingobium sp. HWE2-09]|uniref:hypothetical protein n=1 Tax=Sphingobium sp. HWE2-09 TaxID=3108390 RepID=UPI002DD1EA22|nr:hypothetical protein [Sphingobium sp. HWE2-09]
MSRVDVRDVADAAVACFENGNTGDCYTINGSESFSGAASAELWFKVLGEPVYHAGHDEMKRVEAYLESTGLPEHWAYDLCKTYEGWQRDDNIASREEIDRLASLIGHEPRTYQAFADKTARQWSGTPVPASISWGQ